MFKLRNFLMGLITYNEMGSKPMFLNLELTFNYERSQLLFIAAPADLLYLKPVHNFVTIRFVGL